MHLLAKLLTIAMLPIASAFAGAYRIAVMDLQNIVVHHSQDNLQGAKSTTPTWQKALAS